jgi:hypothetical protein
VPRESVQTKLAKLPAFPTSAAESRAYFDLTMTVLHRQSAVLAELRSRASIVLSATGIIASLLGAEGLKHPHPALPLYAALGCLGFGILFCIAVLWPVSDHGDPGNERGWQVTPTAQQVAGLAPYLPASAGGADAAVPGDLLEAFVSARFVNYRTIEARTRYFNTACVLLFFQLAAWSAVYLT